MIQINKRVNLVITLLVTFLLLNSCAVHTTSCSNNWSITGYFTPFESDYPVLPRQSIHVEGAGQRQFSQLFLKAVKIEGWGKTRDGWYLGYFSNSWHQSKRPLNASGQALRMGSIATDRHYIERGEQVKIPTLPDVLGLHTFTADDVGSAIKKQHIDIYTGEGEQAEQLSWVITGKNHTVCKFIKSR